MLLLHEDLAVVVYAQRGAPSLPENGKKYRCVVILAGSEYDAFALSLLNLHDNLIIHDEASAQWRKARIRFKSLM